MLTASVVDLLLFVVWGGGGVCGTGVSCTVGMGGAAAVVVVEARIFWEVLGPMVVAKMVRLGISLSLEHFWRCW